MASCLGVDLPQVFAMASPEPSVNLDGVLVSVDLLYPVCLTRVYPGQLQDGVDCVRGDDVSPDEYKVTGFDGFRLFQVHAGVCVSWRSLAQRSARVLGPRLAPGHFLDVVCQAFEFRF